MNAQLFRQAEAIFHEAEALPPAARDGFLRDRCGSDALLLEAVVELFHRSELGTLRTLPDGLHLAGPVVTPDPGRWLGQRVGSFLLTRFVASGGFSAVYEGERTHPRDTAAVKLLRRAPHWSPAQWQRVVRYFEQEANILARLKHPNIAHVYDAGTVMADGEPVPYIAMEFVQGVSVTDYAAGKRCTAAPAPPLSVRDRLQLLAELADVVQFAHQRAIIHRDLKPQNILVTDSGDAKILDFGIARVLDGDDAENLTRTEPGGAGTLLYMSPEQHQPTAAGIDVRTDVYSLGVIGFELLSGRVPYRIEGRASWQIGKAICEEEPLRLGELNPRLRGDAEAICEKCLHKHPAERYGSASELAKDIRRSLAKLPISARPLTPWQRGLRFVRRNRVAVSAAVLVFASLIGTTVLGFAAAANAKRAALAVQDLAIAEQQKAAAERGARVESERRLLELAEQRGDWQTVLERVQSARSAGTGDPTDLRFRAIAAHDGLGHFAEARQEADELVKLPGLGDRRGEALLWCGDLYVTGGSRDAGIELIRAALSAQLRAGDRSYAEALLATSVPSAIEHLEQALRADPGHFRARRMIAIALILNGRVRESRQQLELILAYGATAEPQFQLLAALCDALDGKSALATKRLEAIPDALQPDVQPVIAGALALISQVAQMVETEPVCDVFSAEKLTPMIVVGSTTVLSLASRISPESQAQLGAFADSVIRRSPPALAGFGDLLRMLNFADASADELPTDDETRESVRRAVEANPEGVSTLWLAYLQSRAGMQREYIQSLRNAIERPSILPVRDLAKLGLLAELSSSYQFTPAEQRRPGEREEVLQMIWELRATKRVNGFCRSYLAIAAAAVDEWELADYLAAEILRDEPTNATMLKYRQRAAAELQRAAASAASQPAPQ